MNVSIRKELELPNARIVLLEPDSSQAYRFENLLCYRPDGSLKWKAELPKNSGPDAFVAIEMDGSELKANSWSGHALWLDPETGRLIRTGFSK